jgi:hypothetical protein
MIDPQDTIPITTNKTMQTAGLLELYFQETDRDLALLGFPDADSGLLKAARAYRNAKPAISLRIEKDCSEELIGLTVGQMTTGEKT